MGERFSELSWFEFFFLQFVQVTNDGWTCALSSLSEILSIYIGINMDLNHGQPSLKMWKELYKQHPMVLVFSMIVHPRVHLNDVI